MERAMEDERFATARTDPRFQPMRRKEAKVALDSRFNPMLTDPMFDFSEAPVDKLGRRRKNSARENPMLNYYLNKEEGGNKDKEMKLIREEEKDAQDEEESFSSNDDEDQYSVGSDIPHYLMATHDGIDKETHRLAVVNMDWDLIKAVDLYMVMTSCVPKGGRVLSVSIYPTEFGLKCMNIETTQGPSPLIGGDGDGDDDDSGEGENNNDDGDGDDDEEDSDLDSETENKLCTSGLNRLSYYYAVVVCDSSATADYLYQTLDDTKFLRTSNVFDLQFIPDSMEFKYPARDVTTEAPLSYKPSDFLTRPLQHSKVIFLYDEDEPERKLLRRKFRDELDDIASDDDNSSDESLANGVAERRLAYKEKLALLLQGNSADKKRSDDNIKRESKKPKKGKHSVEDKLAEIDLSKDLSSVRKQTGKCAHGSKLDCEPPVEEPDDAFPKKKTNQKCTENPYYVQKTKQERRLL